MSDIPPLFREFTWALQALPGTSYDKSRNAISPDALVLALKQGLEACNKDLEEQKHGLKITAITDAQFMREGDGQGFPSFDNTDYKYYTLKASIAIDPQYNTRKPSYDDVAIEFRLAKPFSDKEWKASPFYDHTYSLARKILQAISDQDQQARLSEELSQSLET